MGYTDIIVTDLLYPTVTILKFKMGFLRDDFYSKTGLCFESMASVQFQLKFIRKTGSQCSLEQY